MSNNIYKNNINEKDVKNLPIKLLYATKSKYEKDWHSTMHTHSFTEIFYVVKGKGAFNLKDERIEVQEDDLVIVNSNISHTESSLNATPLEYIVLGFEGMSLLITDDKKLAEGFSKHNYKEHKQDILYYMELIVNELSNQVEYYESISQNLLQILILNIIRSTHALQLMPPSEGINTDYNYIKSYIDINYASDINLDDLAALIFTNKYSLIREFKKYIGVSPIEYLINKRLEISKNLLTTTDYSIKQIAQITGFSSQSYFNLVFKKRANDTPTSYKDKFTEESNSNS